MVAILLLGFLALGVTKIPSAEAGDAHASSGHAKKGGADHTWRSLQLISIEQDAEEYIKRRHFHNWIEEEMPENPNPALCFVCHGSYPHANAKMTRSILNMHCIFCACETCHFKFDPKEKGKYGFRWYDGTTAVQAEQRHYGTKYDPVTGRVLMESRLVTFKITPYLMWRGKYYMINIRQDAPEAREYLSKKGNYTPEQQAAIKTKIHSNIETKGRECGECHSVDSVIPYAKLGFDAERQKDLAGLNIVGMVEKYQKFYIPDIFKQKKLYSAPIIEERTEK